jgi:transcriptional regulator with XRE-family HTH domain
MKRNKEFLKDLGMKIRIHRTMAGMSQQQVADKCGLNHSCISDIELGKNDSHILTLKGIAEVLNMDVLGLMSYPKE